MRVRLFLACLSVATVVAVAACGATPSESEPTPDVASAEQGVRHNPLVTLLSAKQPVFGLYAPANRRAGRGGGRGGRGGAAASPAPAPPQKSALELAQETMAYEKSDFIFSGSMEGGVERGLSAWTEFVTGLGQTSLLATTPTPHFTRALVVKSPKITDDDAQTISDISQQLNTGVDTLMFVGVESAAEVQRGLDAMRLATQGGTRPADVGMAPTVWGLSEAEYRQKADLWPLNPDGELVNWTIVESKEGLAHVREIAAVKGIGVLWPGAGTLRGVFSTTDADGRRVTDQEAWEAAIQQVLAACKEFNVPCGYPANASDIEMRMKQGFSVFVMNWGDAGFETIDIGRKIAGR